MNPARTLAPSIILDEWDRHWIYWVAPLAAAAIVPIVYQLLFSVPKTIENTLPTSAHQTDITIGVSNKQ